MDLLFQEREKHIVQEHGELFCEEPVIEKTNKSKTDQSNIKNQINGLCTLRCDMLL